MGIQIQKISILEIHISYTEKNNNDFELRDDKQPEEVLIGRAVKTAIHVLYDKG